MKKLAIKGTRIGCILVIVLLAALVAAWVDGGEEPLRPIEEPVAMPESAQ
ncbi:hypothetical protein [Qipengyuania marisflavi]|nr:hypothetical protein [Qipengyuania marisflavi]